MAIIKHFARHLGLPFALPFILSEVAFRLAGVKNAGLIGWEAASMIHTSGAAYSLMYQEVPFLRANLLRKVRFTLVCCLVAVILVKILLVCIEVSHHKDLEDVAQLLTPHWLIVPVIIFLISNVIVYWATVRQRHKARMVKTDGEQKLLALILQVDLPIVFSYSIVLIYGYLLTMNLDLHAYFRGMACALLMVSNLLTISYELTVVQKVK